MKHDPFGYYATLELQPGASEQQIKISYRRRAMALHPDRNPESGHNGAISGALRGL
ncbi:DnaJ domain-containing protein [Pseudomonas putida]|nr:DnaJ domain-containing protein [Pseudomonas putida]